MEKEDRNYFEMRNKGKDIRCDSTYPKLGILLFAEIRQKIGYQPEVRSFNGVDYECDVVNSKDIENALNLKVVEITNHEGVKVEKDTRLNKRKIQRYYEDYKAISDGQMLCGLETIQTEDSSKDKDIKKEKNPDLLIWFTSNCIGPTIPSNLTNHQKKLYYCLWLANTLMDYMENKKYDLTENACKNNKKDFNWFINSHKDKADFFNLKNNFMGRYNIPKKNFSRYLSIVSLIFQNFSTYEEI